ncbi:hypothetical protein [Maricaulis sp.]|uniref:hypothetical protein n=1 Tax=Maricaulis sp. TaxID=1486257 RepID=UPI00262F0D39|nr:hypothetical protein [Maricaulis sp.]
MIADRETLSSSSPLMGEVARQAGPEWVRGEAAIESPAVRFICACGAHPIRPGTRPGHLSRLGKGGRFQSLFKGQEIKP